MKTREEILRLYQEHFGNNHESGVFAVYDAGLADGRAEPRASVEAKPSLATFTSPAIAPIPPPPVLSTQIYTHTSPVVSTATSAPKPPTAPVATRPKQ